MAVVAGANETEFVDDDDDDKTITMCEKQKQTQSYLIGDVSDRA